ncbi:hypothetical protein FXO38_00227 [Capsicum annuum]|nr:hypothetical protein FXO38_00227 [Capsicum annuum]
MKYRIDKVPPHPLHMGSLCNFAFREEIKEYFGEDVLDTFRNTIFDIFLDLPRCNWIGQISKCLLKLEIHQDNKDELHVWVQEEILKFTMLEFNIITSLKCTGNIDDYMYTSSSKSALMSRILNWSVECIRPKYESFMSGVFRKHLYKNIQPTIKEVSRLDLSFSKDFETYDPTTYASTSDCGNLKRTTDELQQCVGTIAKEFGDFSTIPPREILIKADFASPVSPDQPLKKRKTVMFEQDNQAVMDDDTYGRDQVVHHISDLYSETHKDAADTREIGVSEIQHHLHGEIDGDEIKNHINKCIVRVIYEDKIDEQQQSQEDGSNKQERPHKEDMQHEDYDNGSLNDMEVSRDEDSKKQHILEEQQLLDMNAVDKEAGHEDDFENEDCSDLRALEDEIMAYEEECSDEELGKKNIPDVEDLPDEVGEKITDSIQAVVDTILFGLSIPSTTKSLDVGASNKMTERQWDLSDSQIPPDFPDAQNAVDFDKEEKLKYAFDGYTINQDLLNELMIDYSQWIAVGLLKTHSAKKETDNHYRVNASGLGYRQLDFVVAHQQTKNWFYLISERKTC